MLVQVRNVVHRKPHGEQLDQADPVRNEETGLWQCPFCNKNDFPELSEVGSTSGPNCSKLTMSLVNILLKNFDH